MNHLRIIFLISLSLVGAIVFSGCLRGGGGEIVDAKAEHIWREHEAVFKKAAFGGSLKNDEFDRACLFFEQTTGLQMHPNLSTLGALPTAETVHDLERIQDWYKVNKY